MESRQNSTAVTGALTNPTAASAGAATYFDIASANPALTGHLTSALHTSPRVANDALATTINNNASLFSHKELHRTAAGTWLPSCPALLCLFSPLAQLLTR